VLREATYKLVYFIPDLSRDNGIAALNFLASEVNMPSAPPNGYQEQRIARAGVQIAGLATNAFECKSGQLQFLADMGRNLQLADVERS
jgi:N-dimethylarginine dimethylaminohydrolase